MLLLASRGGRIRRLFLRLHHQSAARALEPDIPVVPPTTKIIAALVLSDEGNERLKNQHDSSRLTLPAPSHRFFIPERVTPLMGVKPTGPVAYLVFGLCPSDQLGTNGTELPASRPAHVSPMGEGSRPWASHQRTRIRRVCRSASGRESDPP
jgi:hypothetical protein